VQSARGTCRVPRAQGRTGAARFAGPWREEEEVKSGLERGCESGKEKRRLLIWRFEIVLVVCLDVEISNVLLISTFRSEIAIAYLNVEVSHRVIC